MVSVLSARTLFTDGATSAVSRAVNLSNKQYVVRHGLLVASAEAVAIVKTPSEESTSQLEG